MTILADYESLALDQRDALTGLWGRGALLPLAESMLSAAELHSETAGLILLDCDHFKSINDAFGHQRGDLVLAEIARRISANVRQHDQVFRYGGDEFVILLPHADSAQASAVVQRILTAIRTIAFGVEPPLQLSASAGAAIFPYDGTSFDVLLGTADARHYQAKRDGRDRAVFESDTAPLTVELLPPSRLIERDALLHTGSEFLRQLAAERRGVLRIEGSAGSGRSRALDELHHAAEVQGYAVLTIRGTPALRQRLYGALSEALRAVPTLHPPPLPSAVVPRLRHWASVRRGLVILLDERSLIDPATLEVIQRLYADTSLERIGLISASDGGGDPVPLAATADLRLTVPLLPLTQSGLRTWARHSLHAEVSEPLASWLFQVSGGLPALFWQALRLLHTDGRLSLTQQQITCSAFPPSPIELREPRLRLPDGLPELVGRVDDLHTVLRLLGEQRVVALVGPGGLGKTRLAVQSGAEYAERSGADVCFVPLANAATFDRVIPTIAAALGMSGSSDQLAELAPTLRERPLLLILDNLEHLPGIEALILALLEQAVTLRVLLTSRERPALAGAAVLGLIGLPGSTPEIAIEDSAAAQLLLQRIRKLNPAFSISAEDQLHIRRICQLVDGMPLAIELAAPWLLTSSCAAVAEQLAANVMSLADHSGSLPERHRTIEAVVTGFWQRLSSGERVMLRRLGVFVGGFDAETASAVAQVSPFFLNALVLSGYVRRTPTGRYEIHELLRQYASAQLRRAPRDHAATQTRFAVYFADLMAASSAALLHGGPELDPLRRNNENLIAAWRWICKRRRLDLLGIIAPGMARYLELSGQHRAAITLFEATIVWLRPLAHDPQAWPATVMLFCRMVTWTLWLIDLYTELVNTEAEDRLTEIAQLAEGVADPATRGAVLLAYISHRLYEDPQRVQALVAQACALPLPSTMRAEVLRLGGETALLMRDYPLAEIQLAEALARFRAAQDRLGEMRTLFGQGLFAANTAQYSRALTILEAAQRQAELIGEHMTASLIQILAGDIATQIADWPLAERLYAASIARARRYGLGRTEQLGWSARVWLRYWRDAAGEAQLLLDQTFGRVAVNLIADHPNYHVLCAAVLEHAWTQRAR